MAQRIKLAELVDRSRAMLAGMTTPRRKSAGKTKAGKRQQRSV
jgi:hypothetical protein